jgi:2-dehydropantoate 2-reductase
LHDVGGRRRGGGSSWQSLARGTGTIETDYLNGEIVLLGRLHGVPTPVNATVQRVARELAASGAPPASMSPDELLAVVTAASGDVPG